MGMKIPHTPLYKGAEHWRLLQADGENHIIFHNDAQGYRNVPVFVIPLFYDGNIHNDERIIILRLHTGTLFLIHDARTSLISI